MTNTIFCPNCGTKIHAESKYCIHCGFEIPRLEIDPVNIPEPPRTEPQEENTEVLNNMMENAMKELEHPTGALDSSSVAYTAGVNIPQFTPQPEEPTTPTPAQPQPVVQQPTAQTYTNPQYTNTAPQYTNTATQSTTAPQRRRRSYTQELEQWDDYEEPRKHRVWPIVLLLLLAFLLAGGVFAYLFKPNWINKGIDTVNEIAHTDFKHVGKSDEEFYNVPKDDDKKETAKPTATPTPTPTPEATPSPTPEPTPTPTPTPTPEATTDYFNSIGSYYVSYYTNYLDAMSNDKIDTIDHVNDAVRQNIKERYEKYNKGYRFKNRKVYIDKDSYKQTTASDNTIDITFKTYIENDCWNTSNEYIDNNISMQVKMNFNPNTKAWVITDITTIKKDDLSKNLIDVTNY